MYNGYDFYFKIGNDLLTLPITPGELTIKNASNNKTVTLINEGDINILKSPSLTEITFEARFPMRKYPYSRDPMNFEDYLNKFKKVKEDKQPFTFSVIRATPNGKKTWGTTWLVSLEELETNEKADEGDDVLVSFKLKQYKEYGVKKLDISQYGTVKPFTNSNRNTDGKGSTSSNYTVKSGDCLWNIAKAAYGDGSKWTVIYNANKTTIENAAKQHSKSSSSNGHWIYPGTVLVIPDANTANLQVQKLGGSGSSKSSSKSSSSSSSTSSKSTGVTTTAKRDVVITCNGISAYAGDIAITYKRNGTTQTMHPAGSYSVSVDYGSTVTVKITPKSGCTFIMSNTSGWKKSTTSKSSTYSITVNSSKYLTIKWVSY